MKKAKQSSRLIAGRKRKMMLALPILVIPFMTLTFWALGGGKENAGKQIVGNNPIGLNLHLPDPKLKKETILDKLGFYDKADKDSLKLKEEMRNDPYYQQQLQKQVPTESSNELEKIVQNSAGKFNQSSVTREGKLNTSPYNTSGKEAEEKLIQKLADLNKAINQPQTQPVKTDEYSYLDNNLQTDSKTDGSVSRLESMMKSMNQANDSDPELDKLSDMMDKIISIQHPEKIKEELKQKSLLQKTNVFTVSDKSPNDTSVNGFYGLDASTETSKSNAIEAVVNEDQILVSGSVIKIRLINNAYIKDVKIPAGNFVFGTVSLDGERLNIEINSIRSGNSVYPVKMEVYDMDGLSGIYIPGAISRDVAKQSADNSLQTMQLTTLDPSLAAQATSAGIGTVKNLLSKKVKLVKVMVKAGYKILLKDKSIQQ
ncbi:MAG: conjugative transposon protein TraM [Bacteroidetes bacterium]|nr:conjugative transposon protein TraM [Bacteroidota bacterium]